MHLGQLRYGSPRLASVVARYPGPRSISRHPVRVLENLGWVYRGGGMLVLLLGWGSLDLWCRRSRLRLLSMGPLQDGDRMAMAGLRLTGRMVLLISKVGLGVRDGFLRW